MDGFLRKRKNRKVSSKLGLGPRINQKLKSGHKEVQTIILGKIQLNHQENVAIILICLHVLTP